MTTIVGIQGDGFSVVCVDSRISSMYDGGLSQIGTLREGSSKVAVNGKYLATKQYRTPERWLKESIRDEECLELSADEQEQERVLMGLRTTAGIAWNKPITNEIQTLINENFLTHANGKLTATAKGRLALQAVLRYGFMD